MSKVKVDWTKCTGCGTCVDNCPVLVFELQDLGDYPDSKKAVPVRADDCIDCMTCTSLCPTGAIIVEE
jgi:NAD-dependent dihydropyrimidine dehydrogenase PreA subunit